MKYYTPDISEFRVGFEYEFRLPDGSWEKRKIRKGYEVSLVQREMDTPSMRGPKYRVKYLDEQDILDLGFEKTGLAYIKEGISIRRLSDDAQWLLASYKVKVHCMPHLIFSNLKNKSELQQIFKML